MIHLKEYSKRLMAESDRAIVSATYQKNE